MNKIIRDIFYTKLSWSCFLLLLTGLMGSCTKYDISGSSDLQNVDGRMLFLRSLLGEDHKGIDSCDVVHGKFKFNGALDSVQVVMLCIDNDAVVPVVLEEGKINIEMNAQRQTCTGTPLNDTLTAFSNRYRHLMMQMADLEHQQNQAIMNGEDMAVVNQRLALTHRKLMLQEDKLVSGFIADNFDNCLGPYVFWMATEGYEYPILTPWIEALMTKATDTFKNNRIVSDYIKTAEHNQDVMSGAIDTQTGTGMPQDAPTPNDLATPSAPSVPNVDYGMPQPPVEPTGQASSDVSVE